MNYIVNSKAIWKVGRGIIFGKDIGSVVRNNVSSKQISVKIDSEIDLNGEDVRIYLYSSYENGAYFITKKIENDEFSFMLNNDITKEYGSYKIEFVLSTTDKRYADVTHMTYKVVENAEGEEVTIIPTEETTNTVDELVTKLEEAIDEATTNKEDIIEEVVRDSKGLIIDLTDESIQTLGETTAQCLTSLSRAENDALEAIENKKDGFIDDIGDFCNEKISESNAKLDAYTEGKKRELDTYRNEKISEIGSFSQSKIDEMRELDAEIESGIVDTANTKIDEIHDAFETYNARDLEHRMAYIEATVMRDRPNVKLNSLVGVEDGRFGYFSKKKINPSGIENAYNWEDNGVFSDLIKGGK